MEDQLSDLADSVRRALTGFVEATSGAFGDDLLSIVLYGSAAEGRLRRTSDLNVLVVLKKFDQAKAVLVREPLRIAHAA